MKRKDTAEIFKIDDRKTDGFITDMS